jgi:hypothetical protein
MLGAIREKIAVPSIPRNVGRGLLACGSAHARFSEYLLTSGRGLCGSGRVAAKKSEKRGSTVLACE